MASPSKVEYVTVVCRVCGTRVDERVTDSPRDVQCPDCLMPVRIPARAEIPAPKPTPRIPDPGTYQLAGSQPASRPKAPHGNVLVICPVCTCRMHPPLRAERYRVRCVDCDTPIAVPSAREHAETRSKRPQNRPVEVEPLPLSQLPEPARRTTGFFAAEKAKIRRERPPPPPKWAYFSGVWGFPWQTEVLKKWFFLTIGCTFLGPLAYVLLMLFAGASSAVSVVIAFFALPAIWIFFWTASYGSSTWLTVIVETAAGNVRISEWMDQSWRDGMFSFLSLAYQWAIAILLGHSLGLLVQSIDGPYGLTLDLTVLLLFPYLVLGMLETNAWYFPFSWPVTRSLFHNIGYWVMCYLLLATSFGGFAIVWIWGIRQAPWITLIVSGAVWAALILISGRLIGRLGWKITRDLPEDPEPGTAS